MPKRYNTWVLESYFRIWVGGGCGLGQVPDFLTPSAIPFWNPLTKCNSFLQKKDFFLHIGRIFFSDLLSKVRKVICSWGGPFCKMSKNLYYHLIIYSPKYPETKGHPSNPKTPLYHTPLPPVHNLTLT